MSVAWIPDRNGHLDLFLDSSYRGYICNPKYYRENFRWMATGQLEPMLVKSPTLDDAKLIVQTLVLLEG